MPDRGGSVSVDGIHILLVVRHSGLRDDLARTLVSSGYSVTTCAALEGDFESRSGAVADRPPDVRIIDLDGEAQTALPNEAAVANELRTIWLVGGSNSPRALRGRVLTKPFSVHTLEDAIRCSLIEDEAPLEFTQDPILRTSDPEMKAQLERARRWASEDVPLVVEGELGTGRRALARAVHRLSTRGAERCRVLDRGEVEMEGRAGAQACIDRTLEDCRTGTLILIEPAEWSEDAQRALCNGLRSLDVGPRIVTVARESLETSASHGALDLELQYRLDGSRVVLPALRERPLDQGDLCQGIARRLARSLGRETPTIDPELVASMAAEGFPGNAMGLESRLRSALLRGEPGAAQDFVRRDVEQASLPDETDRSLDLKSLERDTIVRALAHWQGNRTRASESLGISVRTLRNKIRDYGLR